MGPGSGFNLEAVRGEGEVRTRLLTRQSCSDAELIPPQEVRLEDTTGFKRSGMLLLLLPVAFVCVWFGALLFRQYPLSATVWTRVAQLHSTENISAMAAALPHHLLAVLQVCLTSIGAVEEWVCR